MIVGLKISGYVLGLMVTILALAGESLRAQNDIITMGGRGAAMNNAVTAIPDYEWSMFGNPALMPKSNNVVAFYAIRHYELVELTDYAATGIYQSPWGTIGTGVMTYGYDLYRESNFKLAYRYSYLGFDAALQLNYSHRQFGGSYGSGGALGVDVGLAADVADLFTVGANITNLNRPQIGKQPEDLPRLLSVGVSTDVTDRVLVSMDLVKDVRFPLSVRGGIEVAIIEEVLVRAGAGTNPQTMSFGAGFRYQGWHFDFAYERHEFLGWSPGINVSYLW